jgi:uncharacterized SAM-binding protein YcdF (DUF218 family)
MAEDWYEGPADVLVVLGGGAMGRNAAATDSYLRALHATEVWSRWHQREVWITGTAPVQRAITTLLVQGGIPASSIHHTRETNSTREDALALAAQLPVKTAITVLTSEIHTGRARRTMSVAGLDVRMAPAPDCAKRANQGFEAWPCVSEIAMEYAKRTIYWWKNWI